jgi:hypothetical protein
VPPDRFFVGVRLEAIDSFFTSAPLWSVKSSPTTRAASSRGPLVVPLGDERVRGSTTRA